MEINSCFKILPITKSISLLPDCLDLGVKAFTDCIGDPMPKVRHDLSQILAEHSRLIDHWLKPRVCSPEKPRLEMAKRPGYTFVSPKITKTFFDRPSPRCLQMHPLQTLESLLMYLRKVFFRVKPEVFRSCQRLMLFSMSDAPLCALRQPL